MKTKTKATTIDVNAIKDKLALETDRKKISLYLSENLYLKFQKACGKAPASRVMEELMKQFIETS